MLRWSLETALLEKLGAGCDAGSGWSQG